MPRSVSGKFSPFCGLQLAAADLRALDQHHRAGHPRSPRPARRTGRHPHRRARPRRAGRRSPVWCRWRERRIGRSRPMPTGRAASGRRKAAALRSGGAPDFIRSAFGTGDIHQDRDLSAQRPFGGADMIDHRRPDRLVVMGAIDAHRIHASLGKIEHMVRTRRGLGRERRPECALPGRSSMARTAPRRSHADAVRPGRIAAPPETAPATRRARAVIRCSAASTASSVARTRPSSRPREERP